MTTVPPLMFVETVTVSSEDWAIMRVLIVEQMLAETRQPKRMMKHSMHLPGATTRS